MIPSIGLDTLLMFSVGGLLIYLAIAKECGLSQILRLKTEFDLWLDQLK